MNKTSIILTIFALVTSALILTGCGTKYCSVSGCPSESARGSNYCYQHKCANFSCPNKGALIGTPYSYCEECLNRAL